MERELINAGGWEDRLDRFVGPFLQELPVLRPLAGRCAVVLHGSTTIGIDDAFSDLDLWLFASDDLVRQVEKMAGTRFFAFSLVGKPGHFNVEPMETARRRVRDCDLEFIAELRRAVVLTDTDEVAAGLVGQASRPMREEVRRAWFAYHYVEMRGFHRNCDNPIERGDALGCMQGLTPAINHALRAAIVLDGVPYPYIKWLARAAETTPTGRRIMPMMRDILDLLADDVLRRPGPEKGHPLSNALRDIRKLLIDSARSAGLDEPWLDRWWERLSQTRRGIESVTW